MKKLVEFFTTHGQVLTLKDGRIADLSTWGGVHHAALLGDLGRKGMTKNVRFQVQHAALLAPKAKICRTALHKLCPMLVSLPDLTDEPDYPFDVNQMRQLENSSMNPDEKIRLFFLLAGCNYDGLNISRLDRLSMLFGPRRVFKDLPDIDELRGYIAHAARGTFRKSRYGLTGHNFACLIRLLQERVAVDPGYRALIEEAIQERKCATIH